MRLEKAIEIIKTLYGGVQPFKDPDLVKAAQLLIEAGKAWKSSRDFSGIHHFPLLPGETEE